MIDLEVLVEGLRADLVELARASTHDAEALAAISDELRPFADVASRCQLEDDESDWRELRSVAWLFAYRAARQGMSALSLEAVVRAWRRRVGPPAEPIAEAARDLLTDGFAKGREDLTRAQLLTALSGATPLVELAPGAALLAVSDPLDAEGADALAERVSAELLRAEVRALLLHLRGLRSPHLDVLSRLWSVASSARMLGCALVVVGCREALSSAMRDGAIPSEPASLLDDDVAAVDELLVRADVVVGALPAPLRWMRRRVRGSSSSP